MKRSPYLLFYWMLALLFLTSCENPEGSSVCKEGTIVPTIIFNDDSLTVIYEGKTVTVNWGPDGWVSSEQETRRYAREYDNEPDIRFLKEGQWQTVEASEAMEVEASRKLVPDAFSDPNMEKTPSEVEDPTMEICRDGGQFYTREQERK